MIRLFALVFSVAGSLIACRDQESPVKYRDQSHEEAAKEGEENSSAEQDADSVNLAVTSGIQQFWNEFRESVLDSNYEQLIHTVGYPMSCIGSHSGTIYYVTSDEDFIPVLKFFLSQIEGSSGPTEYEKIAEREIIKRRRGCGDEFCSISNLSFNKADGIWRLSGLTIDHMNDVHFKDFLLKNDLWRHVEEIDSLPGRQ